MSKHLITAVERLADELISDRLVERASILPLIEEYQDSSIQDDPRGFIRFLVEKRLLSPFQSQRILAGGCHKLTIGLYQLEDRCGQGSLGPVFRVRGRSDGRRYVLKMLPQPNQWNIRLVRQQLSSFQNLPSHPGIVPLVDIGSTQGQYYLTWSYVEGNNLEATVREVGPFPPGEVARVGRQVAEGLKFSHRAGLIHGLIKPSNIMLTENGSTMKLLDFGIGALLADNAEDSTLMDTLSRAEVLGRMLECASPESLADSSKWSILGDQYSLGCTLYFTATGRYPFPGKTYIDKLAAHQKDRPTPIRTLNPDIPQDLVRIIERLMHKSPMERYRRMDELIDDLARLADRKPASLPTPVDVQTPKPSARLHIPQAKEPDFLEPMLIELPARSSNSLLGSLFGNRNRAQHVQITLLGPPTVNPGQDVILHAYAHESRDSDRLLQIAQDLTDPPRLLGQVDIPSAIPPGTWIGFRLITEGAVVRSENQEMDWRPPLVLRRFKLTIMPRHPQQSIQGELHIGTDLGAIGELKFTLR